MLVLTRKPGQTIAIDGTIRITVLSVKGRQVRLGVEAPAELRIVREETFPTREGETETEAPAVVGKKVGKAVGAS